MGEQIDRMSVIEHWFCPGCGEIDGPRAGMTCHGPQMTGGCASVRNEVVEISHDAAIRLQGAVDLLDELYTTSGAGGNLAERVSAFLVKAGRYAPRV